MKSRREKNRIRKSTKTIYIAIATILLVASLIGLLSETQKENMKTKHEQIYRYTNKFNYDYKVNLIDNQYMTENETDKTTAYVTDLIDTTDLNLNYEYTADKTSQLKGKYSIIGIMEVVYTRNGEEQKIWNEENVLVGEKPIDANDNKIVINEALTVDLKQKNELLKSFEQEMGMTVDAKYSVILKLHLATEIEEKQVEIDDTPMVQIELANKTTKVLGENDKEESQYLSKDIKVAQESTKVNMILSIIGIAISLAIFRYVSKFRTANIVRNEFRQELNRILKICQDKIVQVSSKPLSNPEDVVSVKDFGEIVKVSEEIFKPILYFYDEENEEAWFCVMTGKIVYRYILKK